MKKTKLEILKLSLKEIKNDETFKEMKKSPLKIRILLILEDPPKEDEEDKEGLNKKKKKPRKTVIKYFESLLKKKDGRKTAKKDEDIRVQWICDNINTDTQWGIIFKSDYKNKFGKTIQKVEKQGKNSDHYDILIYHTDETIYKCEEKGNKKKYDLYKSKKPWSKAVQRYNGSASWAEIVCKIYSRLWYEKIVSNTEINNMIGNTLDYPLFDDWWCDCKSTDPKTEWGKENKQKVKEKWKNDNKDISLNGKNGVPIDGRELIINDFKCLFISDIKLKLIKLIEEKINEIMSEKDIWVTTCGEIPNIEYRFWNKLEPEEITDIKIKYNKGSDIIFECIVKEGDNIECPLRWGKGCGFSNLRLDIR